MSASVRVPVFVVAVTLLLAACSTTSASEAPDDNGSSMGSPPPELPTATPTAAPTVLTAEGLGYLSVGKPVPDVAEADALARWDDLYCQETNGLAAGDPFAGAWVATGAIAGFRLDDTADGLRTGALTLIVVDAPGLSTDAGVEVGDTESKLLGAYPSFDETLAPYGPVLYVINGQTGKLVYEVDAGTVVYISAQQTSAAPQAFSNNDAGYPCV